VTYDAGDYRRAETLLRPAATSLRADEDVFGSGVPSLVRAYAYLAGCLGICGNFAEASAAGMSALHIAEEIRHHYGSVLARGRLAHVLTIKGEVERAVTLLEHALSECHKWELLRPTAFVETSLGHAYVLSGRVPDGLALLRQGIAAFDANGWGILHALAEVHHGEACLLAGSIDEARRCAEHALTLARSRAERGWEAYARWLLGDVTSSEGLSDANSRRTRHVEAEEHYGDALALAERLGMRPLIAHCHLGLGKLYRRTGKLEQAQEHLTTATMMYREMDMRFWLEQAQAEMGA
jgi:tetratricopeptide (TPR) repeat protein